MSQRHSQRYEETFARLRERHEGAFVPFVVAGDPDAKTSLEILRALVRGGADALEIGIPFSDPVADGPVIQAADGRALAAGMRTPQAFEILATLRREHSEIPMGLLVYASLVDVPGREWFYGAAAAAGIDSVLVADVPTLEIAPFADIAAAHGIAPVLIAADNTPDEHLRVIARTGRGYTYLVARMGVTGADERAHTDHRALVRKLAELGAPPAILGFGISRPEHVRAALGHGVAGVIAGSALVRHVEQHLGDTPAMVAALEGAVRELKAATRGAAQA